MDSGHLGLGIRLKPRLAQDGKVEIKRTWIYYHRHDGYRPRLRLASYSETTLEAMQTKATETLASHMNGTLKAHKRAAKSGQSQPADKAPLDYKISEICDLYLKSKTYLQLRATTQTDIESKIRLYIKPGLGESTLQALIREHVITWRDSIKPATERNSHHSGNTTANRAKQYLSGVLTWYIGLKDLLIRNVCQDWPKIFASREEETRIEGLGKQILAKLGDAFRQESPKSYSGACDSILLDLLTGGRRGELEAALCGYVYLSDSIAIIEFPRGKAKYDTRLIQGRSIYLGELGKSIIEKHIKGKSPADKIFTPKKGGNGKVSTTRTWRKIRAAAGRPDLRLHGLRHIWSSAAKSIKIHPDIREFLLGHTAGNVVYGEFDENVLAAEINKIEKRILEEFGLVDIVSAPDISDCLSVADFCLKANVGKTKLYALIRDEVIEPISRDGRTWIPIGQLSRLGT